MASRSRGSAFQGTIDRARKKNTGPVIRNDPTKKRKKNRSAFTPAPGGPVSTPANANFNNVDGRASFEPPPSDLAPTSEQPKTYKNNYERLKDNPPGIGETAARTVGGIVYLATGIEGVAGYSPKPMIINGVDYAMPPMVIGGGLKSIGKLKSVVKPPPGPGQIVTSGGGAGFTRVKDLASESPKFLARFKQSIMDRIRGISRVSSQTSADGTLGPIIETVTKGSVSSAIAGGTVAAGILTAAYFISQGMGFKGFDTYDSKHESTARMTYPMIDEIARAELTGDYSIVDAGYEILVDIENGTDSHMEGALSWTGLGAADNYDEGAEGQMSLEFSNQNIKTRIEESKLRFETGATESQISQIRHDQQMQQIEFEQTRTLERQQEMLMRQQLADEFGRERESKYYANKLAMEEQSHKRELARMLDYWESYWRMKELYDKPYAAAEDDPDNRPSKLNFGLI